VTEDEERELRPAGRHEWEQILGRMRMTGVLGGTDRIGKSGKATRGGMSAMTFKAIASRLAFYGDGDGSRIRPGDATIAVDLETTIDRVALVRKTLLEWGMLQPVRGRAGGSVEYRLTLPSDILERLEVLTPAQLKLTAIKMRDAKRGKRRPPVGGPADTPQEPDGGSAGYPTGANVGGPADPPQADLGGSGGPSEMGCGGSGGGAVGGPAEARTNQDQPHPLPTTLTSGVRTAVTVSRASPAVQDPDFDVVGESDPSDRDGPCEHGMPPSIRCPACRRGLRALRPVAVAADPPESESEHLAEVLTFRPRTA
jgi:hypothetical protein